MISCQHIYASTSNVLYSLKITQENTTDATFSLTVPNLCNISDYAFTVTSNTGFFSFTIYNASSNQPIIATQTTISEGVHASCQNGALVWTFTNIGELWANNITSWALSDLATLDLQQTSCQNVTLAATY